MAPAHRLDNCPGIDGKCRGGGLKYRTADRCDPCNKAKRAAEAVNPRQTSEQKRIAIEDRLLSEVKSFIEKHPTRLKLRPVEKKNATATDHEMVLMLSDTHYPEVVEPDAAMGLVYNADVCQKRIEYLRDTTIRYKDLRAKAYHVRKLTVACIGDMLSGNIHEELEITNQFPMSEALVRLAHTLTEMGRDLAKEFPEVELIFMPGNHPRMTKKPRNKGKWDNFDYVLGHFVAAMSQGAFNVQVPKSLLHVADVMGHKVGMVHGDGVKAGGFAGLPYYGLKRRQDAIQALLRHLGAPTMDYLLMGHFHRLTYLQGTDCDLIINGSVKGGDEYSIAAHHSANEPVQALLTVHEKHGLTDLSRLNLSKVV